MSASLRGVLVAPGPIWWPSKKTVETLTYALDMTDWLADAGGDELATVSATIPWSVSGDAQALQLFVTGSIINVQIAGGLPGATYAVSLSGTTMLSNNFAEEPLLPIEAPFTEAGEPTPTPPTTTAATLTWAYAPSLDFSAAANSMYL